MDLKNVDLNLLTVFDHLVRHGRVSLVAEQMGLSQPAVSNALARLRRLLGDALFVRTASGMSPTPYAQALAGPVREALALLSEALSQHSHFDAATSTRAFTLAMTDIGEIYFLPRLMEALAVRAPLVTVSTVRNTAVDLKSEMEAGYVDLALGLLPQLQAGFFQRRLFVQRYVCMFRKGHALDKGAIDLDAFSAASHVVIVAPGTGHGQADETLARQGVQRRIRLTVPHYVAVGHLLQTSDLVATVPERFAERAAGVFGLAYVPHPAVLPEIPIHLFWHAKVQQDAGNQWLRQLVVALNDGEV